MVSFTKDTVASRSYTQFVCVYDGAMALLSALNQIFPALSRAAIPLEESPQLRPTIPVNCLPHSTGNYHPLETQPRKCRVSIVYWTGTRAFTEPCNRPKKKSPSPKIPRSRGIPSLLRRHGPV